MPTRCACALLLAACLGCDCILPLVPSSAGTSAQRLWRQGQEALLDGRTDDSIALYQESLVADPALTRNHLSLAAAYMEKEEPEHACTHLRLYVAGNPDHLAARSYLAELLVRLKRPAEARVEFEGYLEAAQDQAEDRPGDLVHGYSQLVDLAEATNDDYAEHLNRGIALYLLALERVRLPEAPDGDLTPQAILFRAAGELTRAQEQRPDEARPRWYLYRVWSELAQHDLALRWLTRADEAAPFTYLTPAEGRGLQLAWHDQAGR
jgi:hypothetical protein